MQSYDVYAPWYDLQNEMEDVDFYLEMLKTYGGPVLDAGCGTGRLLLSFAREGYDCAGFDTSEEMLRIARRKVENEPPEIAQRIGVSYGDMREFALGRSFRTAMFGCNTFQHLLTNDEQNQALQCMYRHLEPDGRLLIQTTNVKFHENEPDVLYHRGREYNAETKEWVDSFYSYHYFQHVQIQQFTLFLDVSGENGVVQRKQVVLNLRWLFPPELERILHANGFALEALYWDFAKGPVTRDSPWIIAVAYKYS
ncbi:MAG: class I SAM-dependent methyltransferase [Candidatus Sericytochromatia bacterium]